MKKKIDENQIFEKHREEILQQVKNDPYAASLGIELTAFEAGFAEASLTVQEHMVNAHGTVHGAVIYALADHVFSVACNAYGRTSVGLSTTIQFMKAALPAHRITARATETTRNFRTGFYRIEVFHEEDRIATMEAVAYRKDRYFIDHGGQKEN
ncbi:PaaI family thioesterase [Alteribacter natronophilus]|uniref:PaaI family thioesterase n=1 Tax=Alteribacter natronophilus TaxID=2583810 RepID=UPI00110DCD05|nr:hotdog fold thioesterase [Alteribacter natronophilus]TMW71249.1 hotdog fold thioesterase [Alteribacter natronophilus]